MRINVVNRSKGIPPITPVEEVFARYVAPEDSFLRKQWSELVEGVKHAVLENQAIGVIEATEGW